MGACSGMTALVTGASQGGTGRSLAIRLAAEGAKVAINARSESGLRQTLALIEEVGGEALMLPCDLGDADGAAKLVAQTEKALGPIDILVNNAVAFEHKPVEQFTLEELQRVGQVNLWTPWMMMAQVMPGMRERKRGWILNLTSFSAELPPGPPFAKKAKDGSALHGATKAAFNRLTLAAAGELEGSGVAVNALTPQCAILTPELVKGGMVSFLELCEPVEAMVEAALALCTGDPNKLTGRIAYSLQLLLELERPVRDLSGKALVEGWQPRDLVAAIRLREEYNAKQGWPDIFNYHRPHTPYPDALRKG
jgi:NAD(P)-dependent dehydrogenase (short-subunit alcohol dehydrogenase family)